MGDPLNELDRKLERVESLVESLEASPDAGLRDAARELVDILMEFHGEALGRLVGRIREFQGAGDLIQSMGGDPVIGSVLLLHGLHPADVQTRVRDALEQVRPALRSHRGDVELVSLDGNQLKLRLIGTCNGCPSSTTTFRNLIEGAIRQRAPEIDAIELEGAA